MKKHIILCVLWDIFLYVIIYANSLCNYRLSYMASREFNGTYMLYALFISTVFYIILGISLGVLLINGNKHQDKNGAFLEFLIIGINGLFLSIVYLFPYLNLNFIPVWLLKPAAVSSTLGGLLFGIELTLLIKRVKFKS